MKTLLRTLPLFALLAVPTVSLVGCSPDADADLDVDSLPLYSVDDEKADKAGNTTQVVWVRPLPGPVACIIPPCPTAEVRQVNSTNVEPIYRFDWRGLKLSAAQVKDAEAQRDNMLLSGKYTKATAYGQQVTVLQVSRAGVQVSNASSDNFDSDRYYSVKANSTVCVMEPCPTLTAQPLGQPTSAAVTWTGVDLKRLQLTQAQATALASELKAGTVTLSVTSTPRQVAQVSQAFRPFGSPTLK
jgi:hypothetical protein